MEREVSGVLWLAGVGGIFTAIETSPQTRIVLKKDHMLVEAPIDLSQVSMGRLTSIKAYLPCAHQELKRRHKGLLRPTSQTHYATGFELSYQTAAGKLRLSFEENQQGTIIKTYQSPQLKINALWSKAPPLPTKLLSYCEWYVQVASSAIKVDELPVFMNFAKMAKPYLSQKAIQKLQAKLDRLVGEQAAVLKLFPNNPAEFKAYARAAAYLAWATEQTNNATAWHQQLFSGNPEQPKKFDEAVMALAPPINTL